MTPNDLNVPFSFLSFLFFPFNTFGVHLVYRLSGPKQTLPLSALPLAKRLPRLHQLPLLLLLRA